MNPDVDWLYISISRPQPAGTRPSTRSPPVTGRSERRPNDPMMIVLRVGTCHMLEEAEPSLSDKAGNWRTAVCIGRRHRPTNVEAHASQLVSKKR